MIYIGCDPGKSGAMAILWPGGNVETIPFDPIACNKDTELTKQVKEQRLKIMSLEAMIGRHQDETRESA